MTSRSDETQAKLPEDVRVLVERLETQANLLSGTASQPYISQSDRHVLFDAADVVEAGATALTLAYARVGELEAKRTKDGAAFQAAFEAKNLLLEGALAQVTALRAALEPFANYRGDETVLTVDSGSVGAAKAVLASLFAPPPGTGDAVRESLVEVRALLAREFPNAAVDWGSGGTDLVYFYDHTIAPAIRSALAQPIPSSLTPRKRTPGAEAEYARANPMSRLKGEPEQKKVTK